VRQGLQSLNPALPMSNLHRTLILAHRPLNNTLVSVKRKNK